MNGVIFSIMMVGHSLFGQDGPDMLAAALQAGGATAQVQAQIINGAPLKYNWNKSDEAEGADARAVLPMGKTTHLILTEAIPLADQVQWNDSDQFASAFAGLSLDANREAQVYLQETWHSLNIGTGPAARALDGTDIDIEDGTAVSWRLHLDRDFGVWNGIVEAMRRDRPDDADRIHLIPAGQAMGRLSDAIAGGSVPGVDGIEAFFADDIHLNDLGHYFVAMVQYGVLSGQSPEGLPAAFNDRWGAPFDAPDVALAARLQEIAWEAMQGAPALAVPEPKAVPVAPVSTAIMPTGPPPEPGDGTRAVGLAPVSDWGTAVPFLDVMKTARPLFGHLPKRFGGIEHAELVSGGHLDADGWPTKLPPNASSIGTMILTDLPENAVSLKGSYVLRFDGTGVIEVAGRAENVRYGQNSVSFDFAPGPGGVDIRIQRITSSDPPRNIRVVRADREAAFNKGEIFNSDYLALLKGFDALRFMDWMGTNNSTQSAWVNRPKPSDATWATGVPVEIMVALANEVGADAWFNMPHLADDSFMTNFALYVRDHLGGGHAAYVEFSNEVWNWQFTQAAWADAAAQDRWAQEDVWMQAYAARAADMAQLWGAVYGEHAKDRLVRVISSQTGWLGLEEQVLAAPLWRAEDAARGPIADLFEAYAITGYFGGILGTDERAELFTGWLSESRSRAEGRAAADGLTGQAADDFIAAHRFDHATKLAGAELRDGAISGDRLDTVEDLIHRVWPYHRAVATKHALRLIMYEGGSHVVGLGARVDDEALTAFFQHLNYSAEMGVLYEALTKGWTEAGGDLFTHYADVMAPTKWGSWGARRYQEDENPRWRAIKAAP